MSIKNISCESISQCKNVMKESLGGKSNMKLPLQKQYIPDNEI